MSNRVEPDHHSHRSQVNNRRTLHCAEEGEQKGVEGV